MPSAAVNKKSSLEVQSEDITLLNVTDINLLKALAFDRIAVINHNQAELNAITARIDQLQGVQQNGTN